MASHLSRAAVLAAAMLLCGCTQAAQRTTSARDSGGASAGAVAAVTRAALPIKGAPTDYDPLIAAAAAATRVLLGESTHGTHEYYRERARITQQLIQRQGFNAVAIEGDWSPTYRVNLYVRGLGGDRSAEQALGGYTRFPRWMWRNSDFAAFVEQLRAANLSRPPEQRVGLYGADVYDLFEAADAVVAHLGTLDRAAMQRARAQYRCLNGHGRDLHRYGEAAQSANRSCAAQAAAALDLVRRLPRPREPQAAEAHFAAIRAAASVVAAEEYIRTIHAGEDAWNLRDRRMADTVDAIAAHAARLTGREGRVVLWAHNSHVGDARATAAAAEGQLNIGQVMKERHGARTLLVGFLTHSGTVRAAPAWDQPDREFTLRNARSDSHGGLFHQTGLPSFMLLLSNPQLSSALAAPMLQRAVGVVYAPETELQSHYGAARLPAQFDALIYFDRTRAVRRL